MGELEHSSAAQKHVVGTVAGNGSGRSMVIMTGIHGNEAAGGQAASRILAKITAEGISLHGDLTILAGNLQALEQRIRFIDNDLNRHWTPTKIDALKTAPREQSSQSEDRERLELLALFAELLNAGNGEIYFLDLHTSSANGAPFLTVGDTLPNRSFAMSLPLPAVLGLEDQVDGSLLEYLNNHGLITMGVEAGQHDSESAVDCLEAVIWLALVSSGLMDAHDLKNVDQYRQLLAEASKGIPAVLEVRLRHALATTDSFKMLPGFSNFTSIEQSQLLAHDDKGEILAKEGGRLLLPLYQAKGNDGFFIAREVSRAWLTFSATMRRFRLDRMIRLLPGVRCHPKMAQHLIVNTRVARLYPLKVFHLFGYRKLRWIGAALVVSRRCYGLASPRKISFC
jgi:succinylglutamate desuccinylase